MIISKECIECNKYFSAKESEIKRGNAKFCSLKCFGKNRSKTTVPKDPNCKCRYCDKVFYRNKSKTKSRSGLQFCSRICKDKGQRIESNIPEIQPDHYKNGIGNYRIKALNSYPHFCNRCGYSQHTQILQVHHKDSNRENNDVFNLEILCPNCHWLHHLGIVIE